MVAGGGGWRGWGGWREEIARELGIDVAARLY